MPSRPSLVGSLTLLGKSSIQRNSLAVNPRHFGHVLTLNTSSPSTTSWHRQSLSIILWILGGILLSRFLDRHYFSLVELDQGSTEPLKNHAMRV